MMGRGRVVVALVAGLALTIALLPLHLVLLAIDHRLSRRLPRLWHRAARRILGLRIECRGAPDPKRPLMLVANHASWLDIIVLASIADVAFVAKAEVRDWPVFGWLARWQRSVFVDRSARRTTGAQIDAIAERLDRGEIVVLFAEGTTSDGNRVLAFKSALFGAARESAARSEAGSVLLQPVTIAYTGIHGLPMGRRHRTIASWPGDVELLPHLVEVLRAGAIDVVVSFGEPVPYDARADRKATTRALESAIRGELAALLRR